MHFNTETCQFEGLKSKKNNKIIKVPERVERGKGKYPTSECWNKIYKEGESVEYLLGHVVDLLLYRPNVTFIEMALFKSNLSFLGERLKDRRCRYAEYTFDVITYELLQIVEKIHIFSFNDVISWYINLKEKSLVDYAIAARMCGHAISLTILISISDEVLAAAKEMDSTALQLVTHLSAAKRLVKMVHKVDYYVRYETLPPEVANERLKFHLDELNRLCDGGEYPFFKIQTSLIEGILHKNFTKINKCILTLVDLKEYETAKFFVGEATSIFKIPYKDGKDKWVKVV